MPCLQIPVHVATTRVRYQQLIPEVEENSAETPRAVDLIYHLANYLPTHPDTEALLVADRLEQPTLDPAL